jgi:glycosyltransferase involved in cell wall biosynthesis
MAGDAVLWIGLERDGCWWYRAELPRQYLVAHGHDVRMTLAKGEDMGHIDDYGAVVLQRLSYGPEAIGEISAFLRAVQRGGARVFYEVDDDLWRNQMIRSGGPMFLPRPVRRALEAYIDKLIERCDGVIVSTPTLAEVVAKRVHRNVQVIPNAAPEWLCDYTPRPHEGVRIGWTGSVSHALEGDFRAMLPALRRVLDDYPETHAVFMGYHPPEMESWPRTEWHPWVPIDDYYEALAALGLDIFVAPLADTPFNAAKSASKLMELAALGVPIIASPHGPYRGAEELVSSYATSEAEWEAFIGRLVRSPETRAADGARARAAVRQHHTMAQTGPLWEHVLIGGGRLAVNPPVAVGR